MKNYKLNITWKSNSNAKACATFVLMTLLILCNFQPKPVRADEIYIDVDMEGDAYVTIENTNGSIAIVYNGRDVLEEIEEHYKTISDLRAIIYALGARTNIDDVKKDLQELEELLNSLIDELNTMFQDVYSNIGFLLHVTGVNPGNTTIADVLASGNITIADYLEEVFVNLDSLDIKISDLSSYLQNLESEIKKLRLENERMESQYQEELSSLRVIINQKEQEHQLQIDALQAQIIQNLEEITVLSVRHSSQTRMFLLVMIVAAVFIPTIYIVKRSNSKI